jgi:hypothetical protein
MRRHAVLGALVGAVVAIAATVAFRWVAIGLHMGVALGAMAIGFGIGRAVGGTRRVYLCATCEAFMTATAAVCPECGGTVAGEIAHRRDRLDAEERLEAGERSPEELA